MEFKLEEHEGAGLDQLDTQAAMPILRIIQDGSPIVKKSDPAHEEKKIDGAEAGDLVFQSTEALKEVEAVMLHQQISYTEWSGGKPVAYHPLTIVNDPRYKARGHNPAKPNSEGLGENQLEKTNNTFIKFRSSDNEDWQLGIIPFTSSSLKDGSGWAKKVTVLKYDNGMRAAIFCSVWKIKTKPMSNDKGSWYGWDISFDRLLDLKEDQALLQQNSSDRESAVSDATQLGGSKQPQLETDEPF
tara:strand:+ start:875 stop:1603 length:729 start_codon:yes stop_codon:yes gene_type:complete